MFEQHQQNFMYFLSHEIKGWLTKNQAAFAAIVEGDLGAVPDEVKQLAQSALEDTRKGVTTLSDILNANSLNNGTTSYSSEPFDLRPILSEIVDRRTRMLRSKHLTIKLDMARKPVIILGDKHQMRDHVIRNLIDNAIEYTEQGAIRISLKRKKGKVTLAVKDSGVGISSDDMKNLFKQGGRGRNARRIKSHSTGYGLYIAKQIVDAHQGRIWAESEGEGKGSAFYIELPIQT